MHDQYDRFHERVRIEYGPKGRIARLVMENGDAPISVFSSSMVDAMTEAVETVDGDIGCLILCGEDEFSAGADLRDVRDAPAEMRSTKIDAIAASSNRFIRALRSLSAPVIAAVTGVAAGGGLGFALACDLVVMHTDAVLDTAYARIGLTPDNATPFFLTMAVGPYRARELLFDPHPISASEAVDLGLAADAHDCAEDDFISAVLERAQRLADGPTAVHARTKTLIDATFEGGLDEHLEQERDAIKQISDTTSFTEGLEAFFEKREPEWN